MAAKLILPLLSAFVFYAIYYQAAVNGLQDLADESIASGTLPGTRDPLRTVYTTVAPVDQLLTLLTTFFWPVTDGSRPGLLLHCLAFSGTYCSAWILVTLESWRRGNAASLAAFASIFGIAAQLFTFAFATPLYCVIQLYVSVTARKPTAENLAIPHSVLRAMPLAFAAGMLLPSGLMLAPESEIFTSDLKQIFIALWQPWPVYVASILFVVHVASPSAPVNDQSPADARASRSSLRFVYAFAFAIAAVPHLVSIVISAATVVAPTMFDLQFLEPLHPLNVFAAAPWPWSNPVVQVETVGEGVQAFLAWDYLIGSTAVLVWTVSLFKSAHRAVYGPAEKTCLALKVMSLVLLAGPVGAAVELMWEREELVLQADDAKTAPRKA
ncbi:hypothetical protein DCS_02286 [Drechmeria coniospora]|uniref:AtmA protein n=1 Tax=Drechmeria coniospora TaxID=98403 RepID=A0A151GVK5_DRECN|nr:hypothetical protein DCS_02286 [Drechmeria coniospora]KYK61145.1 hypothetical protein DCS_02286 [Drechmeria coniospora]